MKYFLCLLSIAFFVSDNVFAQSDILGVWYDSNKSGKIEIYKKNSKYFGKLVWLKDPIDEDTGKPILDKENPDKSKRDQPVDGLVILKDFEYDSKKEEFSGGTIYDPENGKTYKAKITLKDKNNLELRGYVGIPALGRTEKWTKTSN